MTLDTGTGPGVAVPRALEPPADLDTDATRALALVAVDPFTGAACAARSPVPAPPSALATSGRVAPRPRVTAILVTRDGEQRLARTLAAVAAQTRRPDLLVGADTGSTDRSQAMLATATPHVLRLGRRASFPDAVQGAVASLVARTRVLDDPRPEVADSADRPRTGRREGEARGQQATEWLWLLHDDGAPAPDALARLLEAVETAPSVAVAGCKQVDWDDDQHLLDVGFTTSALGARVTGLDPREVDQGQHDGRSDVLAVSTAGMLIRRDVWEALGGPDPFLAHARDDVDLCHRVRLAGHRVVVVPGAVVAHAGSGPAGEPAAGRSWYRADRRDALHLRLAGAHGGAVPLLWLWTALAAPVRSLWRLVLKQPDRAVDELVAAAVVLVTPRRWLRSRARNRRCQVVPRETLRPLLATRQAIVRRHRDALAAWAASTLSVESAAPPPAPAAPAAPAVPKPARAWARARLQALLAVRVVAPAVSGAPTLAEVVDADGGRPVADDPAPAVDSPAPEPAADNAADPVLDPAPDPVPDAAPALAPDPAALVRPTRRPGPGGLLTLVLGATIAAAVALRDVITGSGALTGPALLPVPERVGELWALARSGWRPVGLGGPGVADPFDTVLSALAVLAGGSPRTAVLALVVLGLPLSALSAWWAAGALTRSRGLRLWAGAVWAATPALLGAVATARPAAVLAHVVLPLAAVALGYAVTRRSVAAAAGAGLALTVVLAAAPSLVLPAGAALLVLLVIRPRRAALLTVAGGVPAVLLLPWWVAVAGAPRLLLADPGVALVPAAGTPASPLWHLLLLPGAPADLAGTLDRVTDVLARVPGLAGPAGDLAAADPARVVAVCAALLVAPLLPAAGLGLLRRRWAVGFVAGATGAAGLAVASFAGRVEVGATPTGPATGWSGPGVSVLALGLLAAALVGADGVLDALRRRSSRSSVWSARGLTALGVVAALTGPLALGVVWAAHPAAATRVAPDVLPALAVEEAAGAAAMRTLVLDVRPGAVRWSLLAAPGPLEGAGSAAAAERLLARTTGRSSSAGRPDAGLVVPVIGALLSDSGRDVRPQLVELGIGSVLVLGPVPDSTVLALDASPGLSQVATSARRDLLWRVQLDTAVGAPSRPSRVRVTAADGTTLAAVASSGAQVATTVEPGPPGRLLVLAERRDAGWSASVDGRPIAATTVDDWAQGFVLPERGGRLVVRYDTGLDGSTDGSRFALLVLALLVALPLPRVRRRVAVAPARPSRPVPRGVVMAPTPVVPSPQVFDADHPEAAPDADPDEESWPMTPVPRRRFLRRVRRRPGAADPGNLAEGSAESADEKPDESPDEDRQQSLDGRQEAR